MWHGVVFPKQIRVGVVSLRVSASGVHSYDGVITMKEGKHLTNPGPSSTTTTNK